MNASKAAERALSSDASAPRQAVAAGSEVIAYGAERFEKPLRPARATEPPHGSLTLTRLLREFSARLLSPLCRRCPCWAALPKRRG